MNFPLSSLDELARAKTTSLEGDLSFPPFPSFQEKSHLKSLEEYETLYKESIEDSDAFWLKSAKLLDWFTFPEKAIESVWDKEKNTFWHTAFQDGFLNVCYNCVDRHVKNGKQDCTALLFQGDAENNTASFTYKELQDKVVTYAYFLKKLGVEKGETVTLFLPMIPELLFLMLACSRIGAVHSVVFGGFSSEALAHRIEDAQSSYLISIDTATRGGKKIPFKSIVEEALAKNSFLKHAFIFNTEKGPLSTSFSPIELLLKTFSLEEAYKNDSIAFLNAEDPLFILYTSGSTGKPKGVVHTQGGYLLHAMLSHKYVFDVQEKDMYWCTADLGWITGHSYVVYGPLANGSTTLMFEGTPTYPDAGRYWHIIDKYKVSLFYTAPTAIRSLIRLGDAIPLSYSLESLRVLGSVGEPINPEVWMWYFSVIGKKRCPIVDTFWQTETGGILITALPGCHSLKPGSATLPFFGVDPVILNEKGEEVPAGHQGALCIRKPWIGMLRTTYRDHERMIQTYFSSFKNIYFTGDSALKDKDGYFWLLGRMDDVINVSGHRIGTAEVESALVLHPFVSEAAVVPIPDAIKGQAIFAFITLKEEVPSFHSEELKEELKKLVSTSIGKIAAPQSILFTPRLPKTRSGKIMRRILRKIAENEKSGFGDISTLAEGDILDFLIEAMQKNG